MSEPHVNSYYAATLGDAPRYSSLEGSVDADVCIVGGGFSGVASALTLAERGYKVVLLEQHRIGWGASGRNGGQMIFGISGEAGIRRQLGESGRRLLSAVRYRGHEIIEERIAKYGIDCDLRYGWMEAAARPRHMQGLRLAAEELAAEGADGGLELVEPERMGDVLETSRYYGGLIDRRSGHLNPLKLVVGEASAAAALGVCIHEDSRVVRLEGGAKPFVVTERGHVSARHIIVGGGAEHPFQRGPLRGLTLPTGSYIICTEPLGERLAMRLNPLNLAVADSNVVLDYFRLTADRRMLFGGRCNYTNRDPKDLTAALMPRLTAIFPEISGKRVDYAWGGRIDIVITRIPAIGRLEPNVYYMQGYCGHGVNATHIAAEIVADAIGGTAEKLDLFERIRHFPMPGGFLGNQLLALGMLYYRLKDLL
jgi:glycine/D-amino acid oxidase-like deaminating enzyme